MRTDSAGRRRPAAGRQPLAAHLALALLVLAAPLLAATPARAVTGGMSVSTSDASGASILHAFASALGHRTQTLSGNVVPEAAYGVLFVLAPEVAYSDDEALSLRRWVTSGGTLVYCGVGDGSLDRSLGLTRGSADDDQVGNPTAPVFDDLAPPDEISLPDNTPLARVTPAQVVFLRSPREGLPEGVLETVGQGRVFAFTSGTMLSNDALHQRGNAMLAADLIDAVPPAQAVFFDETHHVAAGDGGAGWIGTPWGLGIVWAVVALFLGLALRGRAFGPRVPLRASPHRSSAEYAGAVGHLLRRSRARGQTLAVLETAARRAVAEQSGLSAGLTAEQLVEALKPRDPALAQRLADTLAALGGARGSDERLRRAATELHRLAYPVAGPPPPVAEPPSIEERS